MLRGRVGELAAERLARIGERVVHQFLLIAALRHADLDLVAALGTQGFGEQRAILDLVGNEDAARARLVVVELGEESAQDFTRRQRTIGLGEIGAIAPVLTGAEEKDLDAIKTAVMMDGKHVGLLNAARVDALVRLHRRERSETIAIDRRAFEVERGRGLLHLRRQLLLDRAALAGEEGVGFAHQLGVFGEIDLARAGCRAAFDLVQQAWPRAAFEESVRARAD